MQTNQVSLPRGYVTIKTGLPNKPDKEGSAAIARGILVSKNAVLVANPPQELLQRDGVFTAVLADNPVSGNLPEEIPVATITRWRLSGTDLSSTCAVLQLAEETRYVPEGEPRSIPELEAVLRQHQGDLEAAIVAMCHPSLAGQQEGARTAGSTDGDGPWDFDMDSPEHYLTGICNVCHCCGPVKKS